MQERSMSMWSKFVPKFLKQEKKKPEQAGDKALVTSSKDELKKKILEADVQEFIELSRKPQEAWMSKQAKKEKEDKAQQEALNQQIAELRDEHVENLESPPVYSIHEIINTYEEQDDGSVTLPLLLENDAPKKFNSLMDYEQWVAEKEEEILNKKRERLTPHEFYITQGKHMERAFTGKYWWVKDMGTYSCKVCTQKLFVTEHKFKCDNGYMNFWNHIFDAVNYKEDSLENHDTHSDQAFVDTKFKNELPERRAV